MIGTRNEHTIASCCSVNGLGYWSGVAVNVTCCPAPSGTGIVFVRTDLPGQPECPADTIHSDGVSFRTNLANGQACFEMVEHLMAALCGLEIDNCRVEMNAKELPGVDGSSKPFVDALQAAGLIIQAATRCQFVIRDAFRMEDGGGHIDVEPSTGGESIYEYSLDYGPVSPIRAQRYSVTKTPHQFARQVASARTFVTQEQADQLRSAGRGTHVTNQELLVIGDHGPIDNAFRFRDECARHKTLDLIGDLSLTGVDLIGKFSSFRGGHRLNSMLAEKLADMISRERTQTHPHARGHSLGQRKAA